MDIRQFIGSDLNDFSSLSRSRSIIQKACRPQSPHPAPFCYPDQEDRTRKISDQGHRMIIIHRVMYSQNITQHNPKQNNG